MKRAFFEWSALGQLALAVTCIVYWGASKTTTTTDSAMSFGSGVLDVSVSDGTVTLADRLDYEEIIEAIEKSVPFTPALNPTGRYRLNMPGFEFHFITFAGDWPLWRIAFSLLIPAPILLLGAAFSFFQHRKIGTAAARGEKPPAASEPIAHPLD